MSNGDLPGEARVHGGAQARPRLTRVALLVLEMPTGTGKKTVALILISFVTSSPCQHILPAGAELAGGATDVSSFGEQYRTVIQYRSVIHYCFCSQLTMSADTNEYT